MRRRREWLDKDLLLSLGESLAEGEKIRVNHLDDEGDCEGGSQSMIVERKDDGNIYGYCFRCGKSGMVVETGRQAQPHKRPPRQFSGGNQKGFLSTGTRVNKVAEWPTRAKLWVLSYLRPEEVEGNGIFYSPDIDRIVMVVSSPEGEVLGFQTRQVWDWDKRPKYLTVREKELVWVKGPPDSRKVVIVEDLISGIKVARHAIACVLFGTELGGAQFSALLPHKGKEFYIWMDDDNQIVKGKQLDIQRKLEVLGPTTVLHTEGRDPKDHNDDEIRCLLR